MNQSSSNESCDPLPMQSTVTLNVTEKEFVHGEETYNPFEHRNVPHPTSTVGSFFHLLKSSLGSGLLAMPAAFKHTGVIPGFIGTALVGVVATHCVHILVTTSRDICSQCHVSAMSYTETCEKVFKHGPNKLRKYSTIVRHFVDYAMAGVCLGGTSVYVLFIASSLKDICDYFNPSYTFSVKEYCGFLLLPLVLLTQVRHLKFLVPFSLVANICLLLTFVITCIYTFSDLNDLSQVKLVSSPAQWPLFLSTAIFAMEGINVVMPVENEMKNPEHFLGCPGVLNVTMILVAALYAVVGVFGYLKYGDDVKGSITLNLQQDEILALTAKVMVAMAVYFTYCLQMYAPMEIIWTRLKDSTKQKFHNIGQIILRTVCVGLTVILAVAVPDLELLIGLVGAIFFSTLGLFIPTVVETVHKWERGLGRYKYIIWKNSILMMFYLLVLISGCYSAIKAILIKYR